MKETENKDKKQKKQDEAASSGSRRDFLKLTALSGLGIGSAAILGGFEETIDKKMLMATSTPTRGIEGSLIFPTSEYYVTKTPRPNELSTWMCPQCGKEFYQLSDLKAHAADHAIHLPPIHRLSRPIYEDWISGDVPRFEQKNIAFMRAAWDKDYQARALEAFANCKKWDDRELLALCEGATFMDTMIQDTLIQQDGFFWPTYKPEEVGKAVYKAGPFSIIQPSENMPAVVDASDKVMITAKVKRAAKMFGADLVGICELEDRWVYKTSFHPSEGESVDQPIPEHNVIVIGVQMDQSAINTSPDLLSSAEPYLGYSKMAFAAASLARYITEMGYIAQPSFNDTALNIPLAIKAGFGEQGRNGLLQTPQYGPCLRIAKVFTNLPLEYDQPIEFGMQAYCTKCKACALSCPAGAIAMDGTFSERTTETYSICNRTGIKKWVVNTEKCYLYWRENGNPCGNCLAACPWTFSTKRGWIDL